MKNHDAFPVVRLRRGYAIATLIVASACSLFAQGGPVREASALTVLQNSLTSLGGSSAWGTIQDWTIAGTRTADGSAVATFTWIGAATEFCLTTQTSSTTDQLFSGHGSPAEVTNAAVTTMNYFVARANPPLYLPGVRLLQELNNQLLTVQYVGPTTTHGLAAVQIHVSDDSDAEGSLVTPHEWFFDATTFLPLEVQFRVPPNGDAAAYLSATLDLWQSQSVNALVVPSQFTLTVTDLSTTYSFVVGSVVFNSGVLQSEFDPPSGGR